MRPNIELWLEKFYCQTGKQASTDLDNEIQFKEIEIGKFSQCQIAVNYPISRKQSLCVMLIGNDIWVPLLGNHWAGWRYPQPNMGCLPQEHDIVSVIYCCSYKSQTSQCKAAQLYYLTLLEVKIWNSSHWTKSRCLQCGVPSAGPRREFISYLPSFGGHLHSLACSRASWNLLLNLTTPIPLWL